jgi:ParB-like chromosome segregation protein Spo0J
MIIETNINEIKANPNNPRIIKDDKFKKLVKSIQEFPEMLKLRPIVVNDDMVVLGGNMRLKACKETGLKTIPIIKASLLTEQQQKEFIVKDNVGYGEWDWDDLANNWDAEQLTDWGLDIPNF